MKERNYLKKNFEEEDLENLFIKITESNLFQIFSNNKKWLCLSVLILLALPLVYFAVHGTTRDISISDESLAKFSILPVAKASAGKSVISIPSGVVKANPFLPYRNIGGGTVSDVPDYTLVDPPETVNESSDAARVMDTIVSGILYDKFSPSAILNIEGTDYLVKKGDVVNNYKVLAITRESVTVKLGANTYKAGIGEILTEGTVNRNDVSNLNNKFGGKK